MNTSKEEILKAIRPEDLFPGDLAKAKDKFRLLASQWHPDKPTGNAAVMSRVNELYDRAVERIKSGTWACASSITLDTETGPRHLEYWLSRPFEFGQMYIGNHHLSYLFHKDCVEQAEKAKRAIASLSFADSKMEKEMSRFLPSGFQYHLLLNGQVLLRVRKNADLVALLDVLRHYDGKVDPKHVAWIGSGLHSLACYLQWAGWSHTNISLESVLISPQLHEVSLLGGWWYATKLGQPLAHVPRRTYDLLPWEVRTTKKASHLIDLELARATVRELLGDVSGSNLKMSKWAQMPASSSAVDTYQQWTEVLKKDFGSRKFVAMNLSAEEVYQPRS